MSFKLSCFDKTKLMSGVVWVLSFVESINGEIIVINALSKETCKYMIYTVPISKKG